MNEDAKYQILSHLDEPTRYYGFTLDDLALWTAVILLVVISPNKITMTLIGLCLKKGLGYLKKGNPPSYLLLLAYWYLPSSITQYYIKNLPASHKRFWVA